MTRILSVIILMILLFYDTDAVARGTHSSDPHACRGSHKRQGNWIYECCNGYSKDAKANMTALCKECPEGYYGNNCQNTCSCKNGGTCNKEDGVCQCPKGYYGENCTFPRNCENDATCEGYDGSCICPSGYFGVACQYKCSCPRNTECDGKTGRCRCKDGFYGNTSHTICQLCSCSENSECDPLDGSCACKQGFYGHKCENRCPCYNGASCSVAEPIKCHCSIGWNGTSCTECLDFTLKKNGRKFCEDKCLNCYNGHICKPSNGDCQCTEGWYGNWCDKKCDEGYYGKNCSSKCSCLNGGSCDHETGVCICATGFRGKNCEQHCPENCIHCNDKRCPSCKPGWVGLRCDEGCKRGYHGDGCKQKCACNCSDSCDHEDGTCLDDVRCDNGACKCKNGGVCIENLNKCRCNPGWSGENCDVLTSTSISRGENLTTYNRKNANGIIDEFGSADGNTEMSSIVVIISCLVSIGFLATVVAILFIVNRRRKNKLRKRSHSSAMNRNVRISHKNICTSDGNELKQQQRITRDAEDNQESADPLYATVNKKAQNTYKDSNATPEQLNTFISKHNSQGIPLARLREQQCTHDILESANINDSNYDSIDRTGKQYKRQNLSMRTNYEELTPVSHDNKTYRLQFTSKVV